MSRENENRFLTQHLAPFANYFLQNGVISKWFFIRYRDEGNHLRLRFKGEKNQITAVFLPAFHEWVATLHQDKFIKNIQLASYEREIERYGGEELIDFVEDFFYKDSMLTVSLLAHMAEKRITLPNYVIGSISLIDLLKGCGLNSDEQIAFYDALKLSKAELTGYRQWKTLLLPMAQAVLEGTLENLEMRVAALSTKFL